MKRNVWFKLVLFSVVLVVLSCTKDNENGSDISMCYVIETIDDDVTKFYYNDNNKIERVGDGASYEEFTYEGDKLVKHEFIDNNVLGEMYLVFWNSLTIDSVQVFELSDNNELSHWLTMEYAYNNLKLLELYVEHKDINIRIVYDWYEDNVSKMSTYWNGELDGSTKYTYDDKNNIWKATQPYFYSYYPEDISNNNVIQMVQFNENDQPTGYNTFDYVYEYNDKGYPVKVIKTEDGAEEEITYFSYNCK